MAAQPSDGGGAPPAGPALTAEELQPYLDVALAAAREAGAVIAAAWNAPKQIDTKSGDADLVTGAASFLFPECCLACLQQGPLMALTCIS